MTSARTMTLQADWQQIHEQVREYAKRKAALDYDESLLLLHARQAGVDARLGFASFEEYVARFLGYDFHTVRERLRVAEALSSLPMLSDALCQGDLNWSCVRELTRVAVPETEEKWLAVGRGKSVREVEALVAGRAKGDEPNDPRSPEVSRRVLRFDVSAETFALFREAERKLRKESDSRMDQDDILLTMAKTVLEGPESDRAGYQVAVTVCPECQRGAIDSGGEAIAVGAEVVEMAQCDCQQIVLSDFAPASHVGGGKQDSAIGAGRAQQDVPPRIRREVVRRDHGQCRVPGCRNSVFVDLHHIRLQSEGGGHEAENILLLCTAHHRAAHRGTLWIDGKFSSGLVFRHADGTVYGGDPNPELAGDYADAFAGLRSLGFCEGEARRALWQIQGSDSASKSAGDLLRCALSVLRPMSAVREQAAEYRAGRVQRVGGVPYADRICTLTCEKPTKMAG